MATRAKSFVVVGGDHIPHAFADWDGAKAKLKEFDLKAAFIVNGAPVPVAHDIVMVLPPKAPRKPRKTKAEKEAEEKTARENALKGEKKK